MERRKRIILDTHIWLKLLRGEKQILKRFKKFLSNDYERCISVFSIWEFSMLVAKKRFIIDASPLEWMQDGLKSSQVTVIALSPEIAVQSCFLQGAFHGDPGDRIIIATALTEKIPLITEDKQILKYLKQTIKV